MDISPLIDVAFLLLIYFLVTTTLSKQEADIGLSLPGVTTINNEPVPVDTMVIAIDKDSVILVNDEPLEKDPNDRRVAALTERLERYSANSKLAQAEPMIVISCHGEAPEQRFIDVLNACARAGLKNISLSSN